MGKKNLTKPDWLLFVEERMTTMGIVNKSELSRRLEKKNYSTVLNWFSRMPSNPPRKDLKKLANVLNCSQEEILAGRILLETNKELTRLIGLLGRKDQYIINNFVRMIAIESSLLSPETLTAFQDHKDWYITIDKSQKKTVIPVTLKTKKPKKNADMNLQVFFV